MKPVKYDECRGDTVNWKYGCQPKIFPPQTGMGNFGMAFIPTNEFVGYVRAVPCGTGVSVFYLPLNSWNPWYFLVGKISR